MRGPWIALAIALVAPSLAAQSPAPSRAKPAFDEAAAALGASTYKSYCASCHGKEGRGDGALASQLKVPPPDLSRLAERNKGAFPLERLAKVIQGGVVIRSHGDSDLPVWADALLKAREASGEERVKKRIDELVNFLASVQQ